jgi:RecJ-like exonuclease
MTRSATEQRLLRLGQQTQKMLIPLSRRCPNCKGRGLVEDYVECPVCGGDGKRKAAS